VAICDGDGLLLASLGEPAHDTYVRSAVKPFQALAVLEVLDAAGMPLADEGLAIACASHAASDDHQVEAAHLLALAGLDESALRCPPADPDDRAARVAHPTRLAHNCSGKHASFLLRQVVTGHDPASYLAPTSAVQVAAREHIEQACRSAARGPGVDGCGAPAWRLPLSGLATGFARLAGALTPQLARVRAAMTGCPELVGGVGKPDTELMRADPRIVAKRGAEAVFAAGLRTDRGPLGVAVKIADGGARAAAPVVAAVLAGLGADVSVDVRVPAVLGGGVPHGTVEATDLVAHLAHLARFPG
jgi:L-asparaginase II